MDKLLTVFTPTFNRSNLLRRLYNSLIEQTDKNFVWMIIDDGSSDDTDKIVTEWIKESKIQIEYYYKENGGMHTAHNLAYQNIKTELNMCIDSDDIMPPNAVENIVDFWKMYGNRNYAGMIGLDSTFDGKIIGTPLPKEIKESTLIDLYAKYKCKGDKKLVYRTDIITSVPDYPVFQREKLVPLSYKYYFVDKIKPMLLMNEVICNVEYQSDGSSARILKQYLESPKGFAEARKQAMLNIPYFFVRYKNAIHYVSHSLTIKNPHFLNESPNKLLTFSAIPLGVLLFFYIIYKNGGMKESRRIIPDYNRKCV